MPGSVGSFDDIIRSAIKEKSNVQTVGSDAENRAVFEQYLKNLEQSIGPLTPEQRMQEMQQFLQNAPSSGSLHRGEGRLPAQPISDSTKDKMRKAQIDVDHWQKLGEGMTPQQMWDIISQAIQTVPGNKTLHRK